MAKTAAPKVSKLAAGDVGHEHEVIVRIEGYGLDNCNADNYIPKSVEKLLKDALPDDWWTDHRGTRLEIRQFDNYGIYGEKEAAIVRAACIEAGFAVA